MNTLHIVEFYGQTAYDNTFGIILSKKLGAHKEDT